MSWEIKLINYPNWAKYWSATFGVDYYTDGLLPVEEAWVAPWNLGGKREDVLTISLLDSNYGNLASSSGSVSLRDGTKYVFDWSLGSISPQEGLLKTLDWKALAIGGGLVAILAFLTWRRKD